MSINERMMN